jgi:hypothetical protein
MVRWPRKMRSYKVVAVREKRVREHWQLGDWHRDMPQRKSLIGIRVVAKSARSEDPDFTSMGVLLYGPQL